VGRSGAGKSTFINLVCRLYDVDDGQLLIDDANVQDIRMSDLHSQIGVVLQETFLFSGTIAENIAYGKPSAKRIEILRAAKAANAHDFIVNFPDGYDTQVGERGSRLSGGEKQRIAIARAILNDPRILILDEATSAVDTETERQIQQALERLTASRTTVAIAHRLSTLRNANRLLVLDKGRQAELGTHDELMEAKGTYHRLVTMQREMSAIKAVGG
jgi:ATP-binding cassette subfamily B protein